MTKSHGSRVIAVVMICLIVLIELLDLVTSSGPMRNAIRFIRRSTAGEMLNELRLAPDMLTLAATGAAM